MWGYELTLMMQNNWQKERNANNSCCAAMAAVVVGSGGDRGGVGGDSYGGRRVELEVRRLEVVEVTMVMWGVRCGGGR
ncbi:hypothetical protein Tco_1242350 [Tanacetum coccineum]